MADKWEYIHANNRVDIPEIGYFPIQQSDTTSITNLQSPKYSNRKYGRLSTILNGLHT